MRREAPEADTPAAGERLAVAAARLARFALGAVAVTVAGLAVASTLSAYFAGPARQTGTRGAAEPTAGQVAGGWEEAPGAARRFALGGPEFGREPDVYSVKRNVAGGGRLDQMAFGSSQDGGPYLRFTFYRPFDEPVGAVSFWLEMARRAGEAGLALERAAPVPELVATRLGDFEIGLLKAAGPKGARACLGFRRQASDPTFVISGVACLNGEPGLAREALVCAIEAITLAPASDDPELAAFFERAGAPACARGGAGPAKVVQQGRR